MTLKFIQQDERTYRPMDVTKNSIKDHLPTAIYTVERDQQGYHLVKFDSLFKSKGKVYGVKERVKKVCKTYDNMSGSMGVLFTGDKGSGKTLTAKSICNHMLEKNIPVVLLNSPYMGSGFHDFVNNLGECVILIDEFGKKYSDNDADQNDLLSLMDGVSKNKVLFLLTENERDKISHYMMDRPSRIRYHFNYEKLDETVIKAYCKDVGVGGKVVKDVLVYSRQVQEFSFDILQALISEYKIFGGNIKDIARDMNIPAVGVMVNAKMKIIAILRTETGEELTVDENASVVDYPLGSDFTAHYVKDGRSLSTSCFHLGEMKNQSDDGHMVFSDSKYTVKTKWIGRDKELERKLLSI